MIHTYGLARKAHTSKETLYDSYASHTSIHLFFAKEFQPGRNCFRFISLQRLLDLAVPVVDDVLDEDEAVLDVVLVDALDGLGAVLHRKDLDPRLDLLFSNELEHLDSLHFAADVRGTQEASVDGKVLCSEVLELVFRHADKDALAVNAEGAEDCWEVDGVGRGGGDDEVKWVVLCVRLEPLWLLLCGDELGGAHLEGVLALAWGVGDDGDFSAEGGGKENGPRSETAETDDADLCALLDAIADKWAPNGQTGAQRRGGVDSGDGVWDWEDKELWSSDVGSVTALSDDTVWPPCVVSVNNVLDAVVFVVALAVGAVHARADLRKASEKRESAKIKRIH